MRNTLLLVAGASIAIAGAAQALAQEDNTPPTILDVTWEISRYVGDDFESFVLFRPALELAHELDVILVTVTVFDPDFSGEDDDGVFYLNQTVWLPYPGFPVPEPPAIAGDKSEFFPEEEGLSPASGNTYPIVFTFQIPSFSGENQAKLRGLVNYDVRWLMHIMVSNQQDPKCTSIGEGFIDEPCEEAVVVWDEFLSAVENPVLIPPNPPPFADAGSDQLVAAGTAVTLDGGRTFDAFNQGFDVDSDDVFAKDTLTFTWEWLSGPVRVDPNQSDSSDSRATVFLTVPGVYDYRLIVDDNVNALPSTSIVRVTVVDQLPAKNAPVAIIEGPATAQPVGAFITLVSRSYDPDRLDDADGLLLEYRWQQTNELGGALAPEELQEAFQPLSGMTSKTSNWQALTAGTYYFRLLVDDGDFRSSAAFSVEVIETETGGAAVSADGPPPGGDSAADGLEAGQYAEPAAVGCGGGALPLAMLPLGLCLLRRRIR